MPPPPPASGFASRLFLGPALRAQPDRRLVRLVRDGYENAFEEIVRRYDGGLRRYAAAIVPAHRADDVAQDALQKALLALRRAESDVELRPWLFRILRNTALNDLRDQPPPAEGIPEYIAGTEGPAAAVERNEEVADLMRRLRALPEPQRAAIVMRELEGLSHEEIAAALGVTGGAARQMLYRARRSLREAAGALTPLPLLQYLLSGAPGWATAGEVAAGAGLGAAGLTGGGGVLKAGMATVLVAGSVGAGVVVSEQAEDERRRDARVDIVGDAAREPSGAREGNAARAAFTGANGSGSDTSGSSRSGPSGQGSGRSGSGSGSGDGRDSSGPGSGDDGVETEDHSGPGGGGEVDDDSSGPGGGGGGNSGPGGGEDDDPVILVPGTPELEDSSNSGPGSINSGSGSTSSGSGSSGSDSSGSGSGSSGSGSGTSGSGTSGSGISGSGSDDGD